MEIQKFNQFLLIDSMTDDFINSFDAVIIESKGEDYKSVEKKVLSDLKLNIKLVSTFGVGIGSMYPIVDSLMKNMGNQPIEVTTETVVLATIAAISITYIEEKKFKSEEEHASLIKDSKSMLEELKMKGVGNGIIKKLIKVLHSIKNIFSIIGRHLGVVVGSIIDMFAYTSLLIPIMNGILFIIDKYKLNMETMIENFIGLSLGIGTVIAKHGLSFIVNKIKDKFNIKKIDVLDQIETPTIQKFSTFADDDSSQKSDLINEQ